VRVGDLLRSRAREYELLASWHVERSAGDPRHGDAAEALVTVAIVLHELARLLEDELELREAA
jgi:hypothetical protein